MILTPKNWSSFQHYKDRAPAWIKLHKGLLDDFEFCCLPVASRALAPFLWLLASEYEDGKITASLEELAFRLRMMKAELAEALHPLIEKGFFDASEPLAERKQAASLEKERETEGERETEERQTHAREVTPVDDWPLAYRETFWAEYPHKVGRPKALAKLDQCRRRGVRFADLMSGLDAYKRSKPPDRQWLNPETFLNQERWADQPAIIQGAPNGRRTVHDAANELLARVRALDEPAPSSLCDGKVEGPIRLISSG